MSGGVAGPGDPDELEPVLPLDDIQGNVLPGFNKRHQRIIGLRMSDEGGARRMVRALAPEITSATEVQRYRELRRELKIRRAGAPSGLASVWTNIAFSAPALRRLISAAGVDAFEDEAFKVGIAARAGVLGDPDPGEDVPGSPSRWEIGGTDDTTADVLIVIAADRREMLEFQRERVADAIGAAEGGVQVFYERAGDDLPDELRGHEHFGFRDGISQPGVRGRLPWGAGDFVTPRLLDEQDPRYGELARPSQPLLRVGHFLFGYATQDALQPEAPERAREAPAWARNGSLLVFRQLEQDVAAFRDFVRQKTVELRAEPGLEQLTEAHFAAFLVGRWPSGAPLMRTGDEDDPAIAAGDIAPNAFRFDQPMPVIRLRPGDEDPFPPADGDPDGRRCPIWAHIRKVNPRDVTTEQGSNTDVLRRRMLRRGIPYGPRFPAEDEPVPRGLLFLSYQTSITDQFEFLASSWMNTEQKPQQAATAGHDILVGQNPARGEGRSRTAALQLARDDEAPPHPFSTGLAPEWVFATGGGYFLAPSLTTLTKLIGSGAGG